MKIWLLTFLLLLRGRSRTWWGYCPKCNGDAPMAATCSVCHGYHVKYRYERPSKALKIGWLNIYRNELNPR